MIRINNKKDRLDFQMHLLVSENIFEQAKEYFASESGEKQECIAVLDRNSKYLFALERHPDKLYSVNWMGTIYYLEQLFDIENIDYMLFENIDAAVFYELEEHTYMIYKLIKKKYPNMQCIFLDKNASIVLKNIIMCENLPEVDSHVGSNKCIYITSEGQNAVGPKKPFDFMSCIYNSINVIHSLLWVQRHSCYGRKNIGKIIFLIDTAIDDVGLVDVIKLVCYYKQIAIEHGWIPVVKLDRFPNQYLRKEGENMWEYFFEPISEISVSDAMESNDVISMRENKQIFHQIEINPFVRKYSQIMTDNSFLRTNFSLNEEVNRYIKCHVPFQCIDDSVRVLGVIMRGTDYRQEAVEIRGEADINALPETVIDRINELDRIWSYDYIFVATEDAEYFNIFQQEYGNKMIYLDQKRAFYDAFCAEKSVSQLLEVKGDVDFAKQYLTIIYALSRCNGLIVSRNCGASRLARSWNQNQYEVDEVVGKRQYAS